MEIRHANQGLRQDGDIPVKRFLVLVNPSSHGGRSAKRLPRLREMLPEGEFVTLNSIDEARHIAASATDHEAVVACGGDGTVNAVAGGVLANPYRSIKFGVLYAGTSPDFCREHGIPIDAEHAVAVLRRGKTQDIPVLTVNGTPFFCSMNLGIGAAVAAAANRLRPRIGNAAGTLLAVLHETMRGRQYAIKVNGETIDGVSHMLVTRTPYIAGGLRISLPPLADDEYALWFVRDMTRLGCIRTIWNMCRGKPCGEVRIMRGTTKLASATPIAVEFDGDPHGQLPAEMSLSPRPLPLIT
jgi:diacylglycerol kinase family enzyme